MCTIVIVSVGLYGCETWSLRTGRKWADGMKGAEGEIRLQGRSNRGIYKTV
jgi:hypothetical protein